MIYLANKKDKLIVFILTKNDKSLQNILLHYLFLSDEFYNKMPQDIFYCLSWSVFLLYLRFNATYIYPLLLQLVVFFKF